ncbi:MAG: hypothetical protein ABFS42_08370 [Candidatus Krumholzibacteriota bacterium]
MRKPAGIVSVIFILTLALSQPALAEGPSAEELAKANNPLADMTAFNVQNYYAPTLFGVPDETVNTLWFRAAKPTGPVLWRASLPVKTIPGMDAPISGLGDFEIFGAYLLKSTPEQTFGIGPQLSLPTAERHELGTGKTQLGLAAVTFMVPSPQLQYGGLVFWQASVGGDEERADTSVLAIQPFGFWQLGGGKYLRTAPTMAFDLKSGNYLVPFGFGFGQVVKSGNTVFNIFLEPQFTVLHEGAGTPKFQIFTALNMQFN